MKKKFRSRIVAALVAVTALTCCFVGSTFAKYTSSSEKSATAAVAHWEITNISENGKSNPEVNTFEFATDSKISPAVDTNKNQLTSGAVKITNNSDVSAEISIGTISVPTVTYSDNKTEFTEAKYGMTLANAEKAVFTFEVTGTGVENGKITLTKGQSVDLTFTIYWNTLDTNGAEVEGNGNGDLIDTYFGMYATQVKATLTLTATQKTQLGDNQ